MTSASTNPKGSREHPAPPYRLLLLATAGLSLLGCEPAHRPTVETTDTAVVITDAPQAPPTTDQPAPPLPSEVVTEPNETAEQPTVVPETESSYARVAPQTLNASLDPNDLATMRLPFDEVPWRTFASVDPNSPALATLIGESDAFATDTPDPNLTETHTASKAYLAGRRLLRQGDGEQAYQALTAGAAHAGPDASYWTLFAQAAYASDRNQTAAAACRRALTLDPNTLQVYNLLGRDFIEKGKTPASTAFLHRGLQSPDATRSNPITALLRMQLAGALADMNYLRAAIEQYRKAALDLDEQAKYSHVDPVLSQLVRQSYIPLLAAAGLHVRMGEMDLAAAAIHDAEATIGDDVDMTGTFVLFLGSQRAGLQTRYRQVAAFCRYLLTTTDDVEKLITVFHRACTQMAKYDAFTTELNAWRDDGLIGERHYAFALALAQQLAPARTVLEQLRENTPDAAVHRDLGRVYAELNQWPEMVAAYGTYLETDPDAVGTVLGELHQLAQNSRPLQKALAADLVANDAGYGSWFVLGYLAEQSGQDTAAEQFYRQAATDDAFAAAHRRLIELLLNAEKYQDVAELVEQGRAGAADHQLLWFAGRAHAGMHDYAQAAQYFQEAIELMPDRPDAYLSLARVLRQQGQLAQAERILLQLRDRWPTHRNIDPELLVLYCQWTTSTDATDSLVEAAQQRSRETLNRWLSLRDRQADWFISQSQSVLTALERLYQAHPESCFVAKVLSDAYAGLNRHEEALETLKSFLQKHPEDDDALQKAVRLSNKLEQYDRAAEFAERRWRSDPDNGQALADALFALQLAGELQRGAELLEQYTGPDTPCRGAAESRVQFAALRLFMADRRYDKAAELFGRWLACTDAAADPCQASDVDLTTEERNDLHQRYIWSLTEEERFDEAEAQTIRLYENEAPMHDQTALYLVRHLALRGHLDDAAELCLKLMELSDEPLSFRTQYCLTLIYGDRAEEAIQAARNWLAENEQEREFEWLLVLALRRAGQVDQAVRFLRERAQQSEAEEETKLLLVDTLIDAGLYGPAEELLTKLAQEGNLAGKIFEARIRLDMARGDCAEALKRVDAMAMAAPAEQLRQVKVDLLSGCGRGDEAVTLQQESVAEDDENDDARLLLSVLLDRVGRHAESVEQLELILARDDDNPAIMNNLGYSLLSNPDDLDRAEELLLRSLALEPTSAPTLDSVGWLRYKQGLFDDALRYLYQAAASMMRLDAEMLDHIGDTLYRLNAPERATAFWRLALQELQQQSGSQVFLEDDRERVAKKLEQIEAGTAVDVAESIVDTAADSDH